MTATAPAIRSLRREQTCRLSATECVRLREYDLQPPADNPVLSGFHELEVLYSADDGASWTGLPMRISPWARVKCVFLEGAFPPTTAQRLCCEDGRIAFEFVGPDYWDNWPLKIWRATYDLRRRWWRLDVIGRAELPGR